MAKAEYRSSKRSKSLIKHALIKIMQEKPYSKITVTDIIESANISRGTFYAHYKSVDEVLDNIENEETEKFIDIIVKNQTDNPVGYNPEKLFAEFAEVLKKDKEFYKTLILSPEITNRIIRNISEQRSERAFNFVRESLKIEDKAEINNLLTFTFGGINLLLYKWATGDTSINAQNVVEVLSKITKSIIENY